MRTVAIAVHNNQELEIFVEKREEGFELWMVGPTKGRRVLLDHYLTHDDLEAQLEYSEPGDLAWRDASPSEIPDEKHRNAIEMEKTIKRGTFRDCGSQEMADMEREIRQAMHGELTEYDELAVESHLFVAGHVSSAARRLNPDPQETKAAEKRLLGRWTDGIVAMTLEADHKLQWSCRERLDPLNLAATISRQDPDWWYFSTWGLGLTKRGQSGAHFDVLRIDDQELHLVSGRRQRLARVFHRVGAAGENAEEAADSGELPVSPPKRERVSRPAGETIPLLRQLEQAVIDRNPLLTERLNPGVPESEIRAALSEAGVLGDIEALVQLYSWSNGTAVDENDSLEEVSLFPESIYRFMTLEHAIISWCETNKAVEQIQQMFEDREFQRLFSGFKGQFFPVFTDTGGGDIAVDLTPAKRNRVMLIDPEIYGKPVQAYSSFTSFIKDAIRANKEGDSLKCFSRL